jgi:hypothetical protein
MKNSKNLTKMAKNGKNWKNLKLPMKFIEKQKTRVTRLHTLLFSECTFRPKKIRLFFYRGHFFSRKIHQNFKKS